MIRRPDVLFILCVKMQHRLVRRKNEFCRVNGRRQRYPMKGIYLRHTMVGRDEDDIWFLSLGFAVSSTGNTPLCRVGQGLSKEPEGNEEKE